MVTASLSTALEIDLTSFTISSIFLSWSFVLNASSTILSTSFFVGSSDTRSPSETTAFSTVSNDAFGLAIRHDDTISLGGVLTVEELHHIPVLHDVFLAFGAER